MRAGIAACGIFLLTFAVYLFTMVPCITEDDSGEQAAVCATLGTAHSPGYPFYCLAGKSAVIAIPWGNHAYRVNLISALFIALSSAALFLALLSAGSPLHLAAALGLVFAFSREVWAMANVTEVYGTAAFMTCLICMMLPRRPSPAAMLFAAYAFGIGIATHYTVALLAPGLAWWLYMCGRQLEDNGLRKWVGASLFAATGLSIVLYLYLRARAMPLIAWEDPRTLERFWQVVARLRYGTLALAQGGAPPLSPAVIVQKLLFFLKLLATDFTWLGLAAFALGLWRCARDRTLGWSLILLLLGSGPGFILLANVGLSQGSADLLKRFFFLSYIFVVLIMGEGLRRLPRYVTFLVLPVPVILLVTNLAALDHRYEFVYYDYGKNILRSLPENTLLFSDRADEMEFALAYLHLAERQRPDIEFIDCNAGVSRSIYGDDYYRIWGKPRLQRRETVEKGIIAGSGRPVYYATFVPDMIALPRFQEGLVFRAKPAGAPARPIPFGDIYSLRTGGIEENDGRARDLMLSHFLLLGRYYLSLNDAVRADRQFSALTINDASGRWTSDIGFLYHQKGILPLAEKYYRRAVDSGTAGADIFTNLGAIYETRGEAEAARTMYLKALSIDPVNIQTHYNLAVLHWKRGDWQAVADEFGAVLRLDPQNKDAQVYRAQALRHLQR